MLIINVGSQTEWNNNSKKEDSSSAVQADGKHWLDLSNHFVDIFRVVYTLKGYVVCRNE